MPAIVLDDEDPHQKSAGRQRKHERDHIGQLQRPIHQRSGADEEGDGTHQLEQAERHDGRFVRLDCDSQIARIRHFSFPNKVGLIVNGSPLRARSLGPITAKP